MTELNSTQVLLVALFYALVIRKPDTEDEEENEQSKKAPSSELLHAVHSEADLEHLAVRQSIQQYKNAPPPPDAEVLNAARELR